MCILLLLKFYLNLEIFQQIFTIKTSFESSIKRCTFFFSFWGSLKFEKKRNWFQLFLSPSVCIYRWTVGVYSKRTKEKEKNLDNLKKFCNNPARSLTLFLLDRIQFELQHSYEIEFLRAVCAEIRIRKKKKKRKKCALARSVYKTRFSTCWPQFSGIVGFKQLRKCMPITVYVLFCAVNMQSEQWR